LEGLPDGTFVLYQGEARVALGAELLTWSPAGYLARRPRPPDQPAMVITPPSLVELLRSGWSPVVPFLHHTAAAA
jgi:hypothetical protein